MPMLEHAARDEPIWIVSIRGFRWWLVGQSKDPRLAVREAIEVQPLAGHHVWIVAFAKAPARLLAVDDRPAQPARLMIRIEGCEIVPMPTAELSVFLEQAFLHVETEGLRFVILIIGVCLR